MSFSCGTGNNSSCVGERAYGRAGYWSYVGKNCNAPGSSRYGCLDVYSLRSLNTSHPTTISRTYQREYGENERYYEIFTRALQTSNNNTNIQSTLTSPAIASALFHNLTKSLENTTQATDSLMQSMASLMQITPSLQEETIACKNDIERFRALLKDKKEVIERKIKEKNQEKQPTTPNGQEQRSTSISPNVGPDEIANKMLTLRKDIGPKRTGFTDKLTDVLEAKVPERSANPIRDRVISGAADLVNVASIAAIAGPEAVIAYPLFNPIAEGARHLETLIDEHLETNREIWNRVDAMRGISFDEAEAQTRSTLRLAQLPSEATHANRDHIIHNLTSVCDRLNITDEAVGNVASGILEEMITENNCERVMRLMP